MSQERERLDRRREPRTHTSPPAQLLRNGGAEPIEILNASFRGLFLKTSGPAPLLNQLLKLRIQLPTRTIDVHCVPVRVVPDASGRTGVGARFFALNGEDRRLWESYISTLLSPRRVAA